MPQNRRTTFHTPPPTRGIRPLERKPVERVYFFTPELEREIDKLEGVTSCRVLSTGIDIEEIHVIAHPGLLPKKIVRDIESLLLVRFGIRVDHRKISIVQLGQPSTPASVAGRPRIEKIEKRPLANGYEVCVTIALGEQSMTGVAQAGPDEPELRAASRALILALERLLDTSGALALSEIGQVQIGGRETIVALLTWKVGDRQEVLVGATLTRGDSLEDAARATFDAVNRKIVLARAERSTRKER